MQQIARRSFLKKCTAALAAATAVMNRGATAAAATRKTASHRWQGLSVDESCVELDPKCRQAVGGTFTLSHGGIRSRPIPFDASPQTIQEATRELIDRLPSIRDAKVVSGGKFTMTRIPELD